MCCLPLVLDRSAIYRGALWCFEINTDARLPPRGCLLCVIDVRGVDLREDHYFPCRLVRRMPLIWEGLPSFPCWRLFLSAFCEVYYALRPVNTVLSLKRPSAARWMHALFNSCFSFQGQWTISKSTEAFWNNQQIPLGLHYFLRSRVMFKMRKASSNHFDVFVGQGTSCLMHAISVWSVCRRKSTHAAVYN